MKEDIIELCDTYMKELSMLREIAVRSEKGEHVLLSKRTLLNSVKILLSEIEEL